MKSPNQELAQIGPAMRGGWLGELAQFDPRLAVALLGGCDRDGHIIRPDLIGWGEPGCGWGWEIWNVKGSFTSTLQQSVQMQSDGQPEADLWVRRVTYTVQRPNAFAGNIFKAQSDYFNRMNPNIDFQLLIRSYCNYVISPGFTPLENIEAVFECVCPIGFVLKCNSTIAGTLQLNRALVPAVPNPDPTVSGTGGEIPTDVTISFHAVRLPTNYANCALNVAVAALQERGISCDSCASPGFVQESR